MAMVREMMNNRFILIARFLSIPLRSLERHESTERPRKSIMSTGSTQAQPIIAFLKEHRIVPDLVPEVPGTLRGELVVVYPTHVVTYVPLRSERDMEMMMMMMMW